MGADAVAIFEINETGARLVPSPHLPSELETLTIDPDASEQLGSQLLDACGGKFSHAALRPLVAGGGLFGTVAMLFRRKGPPERLKLADGLVDLAAVTLASATKIQQLASSHAELRAAHETLTRAEKLRALGQMAAGVSHDLKNILNPLSLQLQLIDRCIDRQQTAEAKETIAEAKQVLMRGVQTLERLREYSRQSRESKAESVDLDWLVHEASEIARPRMAARGGRANRIVEELGKSAPIQGRAGDILSALVNLIVNAIDAMPAGGTITLRTGESAETSWVQVVDDGPGIPSDIERRMFEPFFTTKGEEGTGLGLAMVYACMQRHGGSITVDTAPGKGTAFTLSFPRAEVTAAP